MARVWTHGPKLLPFRIATAAPAPTRKRARVRVATPEPKPSLASKGLAPLRKLRGFWLGETDLAPLGLFRIVFGALLVMWFAQLGQDLEAFYTDVGMLPRAFLFAIYPDRLSLLNLFGSAWQVTTLWALSLIVSVLVMVGYRTRLACALAFLALISFQMRNPLVINGADVVFRMAAFWLIFSAAGERFSVDAALRRARGQQVTGYGPAFPIRLLELQVAWIYLATGLEKHAGERWMNGTALHWALSLKYTYSRPFATFLTQFEPFIRWGTWGALVQELAFLPMVFFPAFQPFLRVVAVLSAVMLHLGIVTTMQVGNFPLIMLATLIIFLPAGLVLRLMGLGRYFVARQVGRLYYDGNCSFCRRTVAFTRALDFYQTAEFVDFRQVDLAEVGLERARLERRICLVDARGRVHEGFAAYARIARGIPLLLPLAVIGLIPGISHLAARLYDFVAARRLLILSCPGGACALQTAQLPPVSHQLPSRPVRSGAGLWPALTAIPLLLIALGAFTTAMPKSTLAVEMPTSINGLIHLVSLNQRWNMFAPIPMSVDGWLRAPGVLADGTLVELVDEWGRPNPRNPRVVTDRKSVEPPFSPLFQRWWKIQGAEGIVKAEGLRSEYAKMYCRMRNRYLAPGESPLATFELYYISRAIPAPGQGEPIQRTHLLWKHRCF
jgi:predicted DCC family thiol-disulfide oxidoreductase YuxK